MLKKANMNWTGKSLTNQIKKGNVCFDCAVQRGYVWDGAKNSLLIHSMIEGYPIPPFFFAKREDGKYDALDGKQRSAAISGFINGDYALCDGFEVVTDDNGNEHDFSGMTYDELPDWAKDAIKDYTLTIYYFESLTIDERDSMFYRLNNGKPLSAIELTRVKARSLELFQSIATHELVNLAVTEKGKIRYYHENLAMQAWAICFADDVSFDTKTFRGIVEAAVVEAEHVDTIKAIFDILLDIHGMYNAEDKREKRMQKRIVTRTHTVSLTKAAHVAISRGYDMKLFKTWAMNYFSGTTSATIDDVYNSSFGAGSARKDKVDARMNAIVGDLSKFFAVHSNDVPHVPQAEQTELADTDGENTEENTTIHVPFVSVWEGGENVETSADVNIQTGEVTNIAVADIDNSLDVLVRQYVVIDDSQVEVYDDEEGFDFWADVQGKYENSVAFD